MNWMLPLPTGAAALNVYAVEQLAGQVGALEAAHRGYVMDSGLITLSGKASDLLHDSKVRAAYLGEAAS